jgi:glycosyltransferase involved in cell wall biosynthesis
MPPQNPLVTIGIPFHNAHSFLLDAVRSIFAQTYTNWELVLANDGSTDGSDKLARSIRDRRVRVVGDGTRRFISFRLNQITREAHGEYLMRMDGDDLCAPDRLEKQIRFLQAYPELDGCGTGMYAVDNSFNLVGVHHARTSHEEITARPWRGIGIIHASWVAQLEWFRRFPYNEAITGVEDWDLWLRSYKSSRFGNVDEPLYIYRGVGTISLQRYARTKCRLAKLLMQCSPAVGPMHRRLSYGLKQYAEFAAYAACSLCGLSSKVTGRKGLPATSKEVRAYDAIIRRIRSMDVPLED